jgi:LacI family transcriptional regulator
MANVSHMTVSRVLNRDPRVKQETRRRIQKIIDKLNYRPHPNARSLASKKSHLLGLIVADIRNQFYAELSRGIEDKARKAGYSVIFCSTDNQPDSLKTYIEHLNYAGVDGFIIASSRLNEPVVENLVLKRFPLVLVNRNIKSQKANYVVLDNEKGSLLAISHLISLNYTKIAAILGPSNLSTGIDRLNGYKQALRENNIPCRDDYVIQGPFTKEVGYEGAIKLLSMDDRPEAIFGGNDYIALGVIDAIDELGLKIPEDIAVVGFDDTEFASNKRINLTTVSQRKYEMGNLGVQILIDSIERKETDYQHRVVLKPRLIIRESCGHKIRQTRFASEERVKYARISETSN